MFKVFRKGGGLWVLLFSLCFGGNENSLGFKVWGLEDGLCGFRSVLRFTVLDFGRKIVFRI